MLRRSLPNQRLGVGPTIRSPQGAIGPLNLHARRLSIDILFHAQYDRTVSREITRIWAENHKNSSEKQGRAEVDLA